MKTKKEIEKKLEVLEFGRVFVDEKDSYTLEKSIELLRWVLD